MREKHPKEFEERNVEERKVRYEITRKVEFDAGHRVYGHEGKCASIHGHRYSAFITCKSKVSQGDVGLDSLGRVIDFSVIKQVVGAWIDENFDHGMLLFKDDPLCEFWSPVLSFAFSAHAGVGEHKHYIMEDNPTAENIAKLLFHKSNELLGNYDIRVTKIVVQETPNCSSSYTSYVE